jgi:DNA-binding winged helix-turn-helix (wHTH) protein
MNAFCYNGHSIRVSAGEKAMQANRAWTNYRLSYRSREMETLAGWIQIGTSGTVAGVTGIGKSNLLGFLCHRPEAIRQYLPSDGEKVIPIAVDINSLPTNDVSTLYRIILRGFYESRQQFGGDLRQAIKSLYQENRAASDPFLPQSALRELFLMLQDEQIRVVLVLDRFDRFCEYVDPPMTDTLRGLRDSFKDTLSYFVGMRQEVAYSSNPSSLGDLYELLDSYICWVQPMNVEDARQLISTETHANQRAADEKIMAHLISFTGGHPGLLKAAAHWWMGNSDAELEGWLDQLLAAPTIQYRLERIWSSLSLAEQEVMMELAQHRPTQAIPSERQLRSQFTPDNRQLDTVSRLVDKGLLRKIGDDWTIQSGLLLAYVGQISEPTPGSILVDPKTDSLFQGKIPLSSLSPLERNLLFFLVSHPRSRHTHTELIEAVWSETVNKEGVSTEALYQTVRGLRRKIEPVPSKPRYVVSWRGAPEGGYQCFPEGRPG